jgi:hypothetical protein
MRMTLKMKMSLRMKVTVAKRMRSLSGCPFPLQMEPTTYQTLKSSGPRSRKQPCLSSLPVRLSGVLYKTVLSRRSLGLWKRQSGVAFIALLVRSLSEEARHHHRGGLGEESEGSLLQSSLARALQQPPAELSIRNCSGQWHNASAKASPGQDQQCKMLGGWPEKLERSLPLVHKGTQLVGRRQRPKSAH